MISDHPSILLLKNLKIDTYKEAVVYMHQDCHVCRSEGFATQARIKVTLGKRSILATLNIINSDLLALNQASLSSHAWELLNAQDGDQIILSHPKPLTSLSHVRSKIYGNILSAEQFDLIISDVVNGRYADIHIAAFLTACAGGRLSKQEIVDLTNSMVKIGERLTWDTNIVVDKHCVGGLPGNRTSLIIVPIVAAFGLTMPKTSSRAITSPAGTADTMETLAPVNLDIIAMRKVVEQENACIVWGGSVTLSPADDILIGVERVINLDSDGQLVASILSKKIAAGSTHILIDMPIGPTAKIRSQENADILQQYLQLVAANFGVQLKAIFTDGMQPIGYGIGPALEARDVLAVLQCNKNAPLDLRERALTIAGHILEFSPSVKPGTGLNLATEILNSGSAWKKFTSICTAQGGMREPPIAALQHIITASNSGNIVAINNREMAKLATLVGAPKDKAAGIELLVKLGTKVQKNQPLFKLHAESKGALHYALSVLEDTQDIIKIEEL